MVTSLGRTNSASEVYYCEHLALDPAYHALAVRAHVIYHGCLVTPVVLACPLGPNLSRIGTLYWSYCMLDYRNLSVISTVSYS